MDFMNLLSAGPKKTFVPADGAPSIYADQSQWANYRANQQLQSMMEAAAQSNEQQAAQNEFLTQTLLNEIQAEADIAREVGSLLSRYPTTESVIADTQEQATTGQDTAKAGPKHAKEDLINSNWNAAGIKAFTDEKGQLVLTNNPAATDAKSAMRPFNLPSTSQTSGTLSYAEQVRKAKTGAEARGIAEGAANAIAQERISLHDNTYKLVSTKLGLPQLRQELDAAIARDRRDPLYRPGMGDSPITGRIRTAISQLEDQAQQETQRTLGRNVRYAQLDVAAASIKGELERFVRMEDRIETAAATRALNNEMRQQQKQEDMEAFAASLPAQVRDRTLKLYPDLAQAENKELAIGTRVTAIGKGSDKALKEALEAPDAAIPTMAVRGNRYAEELFVQSEAANSGREVEAVRKDMKNIQALMDPATLRAQMNKLIPANVQNAGEKRKAALADIAKAEAEDKMANSAEGKARFQEQMAQKAIALYRAMASDNYLQDLTNVRTADKRFNDAIAAAKANGGKSDFDSVMASYVGTSAAPADYAAFRDIVLADVNTKSKSFFGAPSASEIRARVDKASMSWITKATNKATEVTQREPFGIPGNIGLIQNIMNLPGQMLQR